MYMNGFYMGGTEKSSDVVHVSYTGHSTIHTQSLAKGLLL